MLAEKKLHLKHLKSELRANLSLLQQADKCEEVEREIESCAVQLARDIPQVLTKTSQITGEVASLETSVAQTEVVLKDRALAAKSVIGGIHDLHHIKNNMQSACDSLKEATELSELFVRVDAVFNTGDIFAMAKIMTTMHRSLKLVGNVPEFESGKKKMKGLEESLIASIKGQLLSAISHKTDDLVVKLGDILFSLDAFSTLEDAYISTKRKEMESEIKVLIGTFADQTLTEITLLESVRNWHVLIHRKLDEEIEWCLKLFPSHGIQLLISLLESLTQKLKVCSEDTLNRFSSVSLSIALQKETFSFIGDLRRLLPSSIEKEVLINTALKLTEFEIQRSVQLEQTAFMQMINKTDLSSKDVRTIVQGIETSQSDVFQFAKEAIARSVDLTGGIRIPVLVSELQSCLQNFIFLLTNGLRHIRSEVLQTETTSAEQNEDPDIASILHLFKIGDSLSESLLELQDTLKQAAEYITVQVKDSSLDSFDAFSMAQQRLARSIEGSITGNNTLLGNLEWTELESVRQSVEGFKAATDALVFDVFMQKPRSLFQGFSAMLDWSKDSSQEMAETSHLPQFSAYPLQYVTSLGEYLMLVPQQLEALVSPDISLDDQQLEKEEEMASLLLTRVLNGAIELYADEVLGISHLSTSGSAQLACDLQYFTNVLTAMGTTLPPPLATVYEAIKALPEHLMKIISDSEMPENDIYIYKTIQKMKMQH